MLLLQFALEADRYQLLMSAIEFEEFVRLEDSACIGHSKLVYDRVEWMPLEHFQLHVYLAELAVRQRLLQLPNVFA